MKKKKNPNSKGSLFDDSIYKTFLNDKIIEKANRLSEVRGGWKRWSGVNVKR